jgi:hypothetical protein
MKITVSQLRRIIREEVEKNLTESNAMPLKDGGVPDSLDVHDEFMMWVDRNGEVPIEKLAAELGVEPEQIDWNGTGLRVIDGVVTELLSDTPYRTSR